MTSPADHLPVAAVWQHAPADLKARLERCISIAAAAQEAGSNVQVFFRADDVAVPSRQLARMMDIFKRLRAPLCLAVVPVWLTRPRWRTLEAMAGTLPKLWCWHQHGWRHVNHEPRGKKQEFGPARSAPALKADLVRGRRRLECLMGSVFYPAFTPPWNRCDGQTLRLLSQLDYANISRSQDAQPPSPPSLPDMAVQVDLHTRKEQDATSGWEGLLTELQQGLSSGQCGIMLHHRRMNHLAFDFLTLLLQSLIKQSHFELIHFGDLHKAL